MSIEENPLWEGIARQAKKTARYVSRVNRNAVTSDDIFQHLIVWVLEHWHKIEEWDAQQSLMFKLRKTFNNEAQKFVVKERAIKSRVRTGDFFFYTPEILHELLRDIWDYEGWMDTPDLSTEFITKTAKVSEGNGRLAMFSDVSDALRGLNEADRNLLRQRYSNGGMDFDALAAVYEMTEEAMRKRVRRAIHKLQDRLGGEPPVWHNRRRKVMTNAQAAAQTRNQDI